MVIELPRDVTRVWDLAVPCIVEGKTTHIYLTDEIGMPSEYNESCFKLKSAKKTDKFVIHLNTPGGLIDSAFMLIDAIKSSKASISAELYGTVASAGTIIALACPEVSVAPNTAFMIHNYSSGLSGKGHEMKAHQQFVDANLNIAFKSLYRGFLTESECEDVIDGKDLWLNKDEVEERLTRR